MGNVRMRAEQINYGASNVKVALDDLDPKDLIALSERMDTIEAWKATVKAEEKTGAEVTFTNALALDAVSLSAEIEAEQDLHSYDKPWVGGAGKNKFNPNFTGVTGITPSVDSNGYLILTVSGAVSETFLKGQSITLKANTAYTLSCAGASSDVKVSLRNSDGSTIYASVEADGGSSTYTPTEDITVYFYIRVETSAALTATLKPQLEEGASATAFVRWENICPISGHTSVTITRTDAESQTADFTIQLGQTVYGCTVNVTTGVLTIKTARVDMGDLQWGYNSNVNRFYATVADGKYTGSDVGMAGRCSCYAPVAVNWRNLNSGEITFGTSFISGSTSTIVVYDTAYTDATAFKTAVTGQDVEYELAEPIEFTLTPVAVEMLKGYNQISSDGGGDITVEAYTGAAWGGDE